MGNAAKGSLQGVEPVDVDELLAGMTDEQRAAVHDAAAAVDAAAFVRRVREVNGLDRATFAAKAGIDEEQLVAIETANCDEAPSLALLARIAGAVDAEMSITLRGETAVFGHAYTISDVDEVSEWPTSSGSSFKGMMRGVLQVLNEQQGYGIIKPESGGDDVLIQPRVGLRLDNLHAGQRLAVAFEDDRTVRLIVEH
jgi:cold shock CspA family protein/DNA-binding XRE family transcriptional regulator